MNGLQRFRVHRRDRCHAVIQPYNFGAETRLGEPLGKAPKDSDHTAVIFTDAYMPKLTMLAKLWAL